MRHFLLTVAMVLMSTISSWGAKANSLPMTFQQPDGTIINVLLHGDENMHFFTTEDGVLLSRQEKAFYIASKFDGEMLPTNVLAHNKAERSFAEAKVIEMQDRQAIFNSLDAARAEAVRKVTIAQTTPAYFAHSGSPKVLVVLAEYSDCPFTIADPQKTFNQFFNAEGVGNHENYGNDENRNYMSVREYFKTCSRGLFTPEFVVTEPVKVGTMSTYGGSSETSSSDESVTLLLQHSIEALTGKFDPKEFDNDGDGKVDLVYIIFSGYSQNNGGPANSIWSKTGGIKSGSVNGIELCWYSCTSELNFYENFFTSKGYTPWVNGIGVTCHELSHALGLPDVYPTNANAYVNNQEMEYWDLMDAGEYINNGYSPRDYTAWECEVMEWQNIEEITADDTELTLTPLLEGGKAYKFCNPAKPADYFVCENVQNHGLNQKFPGHGMIVYHVNYTYAYVDMNRNPNNTRNYPGMAIVPADGIVLSAYISESGIEYRDSHKGDPFPGTSNVTSLSYKQELPNYTWGWGTDRTVKNGFSMITEDAETGTVTATYHKDMDAYYDSITAISSNAVTEQNDGDVYDITGRKVSANGTGLIIKNNKKYLNR